MEVFHCANKDIFCSRDLDVNPMTFIYEFHPYCLEIHRMCKINMNFLRQGFRKLSSDRQTDRHTGPKLYTTPLGGWSNSVKCDYTIAWLAESYFALSIKFLVEILSSLKPCLQTLQWRLQWRNSMPRFLEVVRQHILDVVGNVVLCFVANL